MSDIDRLHALFAPAIEEVRTLGQWASKQAWADWNMFLRLTALEQAHEARRQERRAVQRSFLFPLSFFSFRLRAAS